MGVVVLCGRHGFQNGNVGVPVRYQCDLSQPLQSSVCQQFAAAGYFYYLTLLLSDDPLSVDSETIFLLTFIFQNPLAFSSKHRLASIKVDGD